MNKSFQIIIQRSILVKALAHVQSIVERKNIESISSHLKLEANHNQLVITATDGNLSIAETISAEIIHSGSLTLPAYTLYEIVRKFSDEAIEIKIDPNQNSMVEISSGYSIFHLPYLSSVDFAHIDIGHFDCKFTLIPRIMQKAIEKNRHTISQEDTRYHLNGIYFHVIAERNELRATATDGHRLSSVKFPIPENAENMPAVIIPRKSIFEISKILTDNPADIIVEISPVKIRLTIGNVIIVSKLIDADFPDYLNLIPYNNSLSFSLASVEMARAVDRVSTVMMEKSQAIKLIINKDKLELQAGGINHSLGNEKLEIHSNIDNFEISFNAKYLLDIMASISQTQEVEFKLSDPFSAVLVRSREDDQTDFVIMPMRA